MPTYTYECERCGRRDEQVRTIAERAEAWSCGPECRGTMRLVPSLPAPPQGSFDSPRSPGYRMQRYTAERLAGKRDGPHDARIRELGFEPRPASDTGVTDDRKRS